MAQIEAQTRPTEGVHVTKTGRRYARVTLAAEILKLSQEMIRRRIAAGVVKILQRKDGALVSLDDLEARPEIAARLNAEIIVDEDGFHEDEEGRWCTVDAFYESLDQELQQQTTKQAILIQAQTFCRSKEAIDRIGRPGTKIYLYDELFDKGLALLRIEKIINPHTRHHLDEHGVKWGSKRFWIDYFRVKNHALNKGVKLTYGSWDQVPSEEGRNAIIRHGKVNLQKRIPVFSEPVIRKILTYIFDAEIKVKGGVHHVIDETNRSVKAVYHSATKLGEEMPLDRDYIHQKLMKCACPYLDGVDQRSGATVRVFELNRAREIFRNQITVVTETDEKGEWHDIHHDRCVTVERYCEEHLHIKRDALEDLIEDHKPTRLRRRDKRNNQIVILYPEKILNKLSNEA